MKLQKFKLSILLAVFCLASCQGQAPGKQSKLGSDTTVNDRFRANQQILWNNLPKALNWTNDYEGLFSGDEEIKLNSIISAFEKETSAQICIVTLDTNYSPAEKFDDLALHIAHTWGVGQKDKNNGVTICISKGHKRIRICNGYGITKILSDQETKVIVDKFFIPKFKQGEYFQGTLNGLNALIDTLRPQLN